jgi:predicted phosphodiesterase
MYEKRNKSVFVADLKSAKRKDFEKWFLLSSDHHFDSTKCNRKLIKHHLDQAKERNADVLMFGDFFDCMQGKYDPRGSKHDLRDELRVPNYFDALVDQAADFLAPYKDNIKLITKGNHETSVLKHQEVDLIERLGTAMNLKHGAEVQTGGYAGYVILRFFNDLEGKNGCRKKVISFTHGYGGGGPVTKGTIQSARKAVYLPEADIVLAGHIHESWILELTREKLSARDFKPYLSPQWHIQLPTYKEEYLCGEGWHRERGSPPKPSGAWWLRCFWSYQKQGIDFDIIRAK